jgi:hypothetical protein
VITREFVTVNEGGKDVSAAGGYKEDECWRNLATMRGISFKKSKLQKAMLSESGLKTLRRY